MNKNFDSELQTYFGDIKQAIKQEHVNYLKAHPELRQILNDFLSSCLLEQPDNVYDHAKKFFAYFNYQKDATKYQPLVMSGCSGAGKGTIIKFLLDKFPDLFELSISYTTRRPRQGEVHGREYFFVTKQEFQKQIEKDVFAEYCEVHGNFYGTHKGKLNEIINKGKICVLDIDLQGAQKIYKSTEGYNYLFIQPPSLEVLEQRLTKRGTENAETIEKRMKNARGELEIVKQLPYYQYLLNDEFQMTKEKMVEYLNTTYNLSLSM